MTVNITIEKRVVHNVVGFWPGETNEYIILGAHYDHLGLGLRAFARAVFSGNGPSRRR